jgi:hypothetical protein
MATRAVTKRTTKQDIANIQEQLRKQATELQNRTAPRASGKIGVSLRGLDIPGVGLVTGPTDVVILDFIARNVFYPGDYVAGEFTPPDCMAQGFAKNDDLIPIAGFPDVQAATCAECGNNRYGTARGGTGKGKACQNRRLLAVLAPDSGMEDDILILDISPTAVPQFDNYIATLSSQHGLPPISFTTEVSVVPTAPGATTAKVQFGNPKPNQNLATHFARQAEATQLLSAIPEFSATEEEPAKKPAPRKPRARK